jgi:hypothetical protein
MDEDLPEVRDEDHRPYSRRADYRMARIGAGTSLTFTLIGLLVVDAFSVEYEASPTVLGVLSTMILVLLGIEATSLLRGDKS